jgi:zinc transport system substrate-binding protein
MKAKLFGVSLVAMLALAAPAHADAPRVVASIAPLHSLVAMVMEGVGEPELLIPAALSVHEYALKPSDVRKVAQADLVVWIGESLESYLVKPLQTEDVANLELIDAEGIDAHSYGAEDDHKHDEHHAAEHGAEEHEEHLAAEEHEEEHGHHHHAGLDPHIWLDPVRAIAIVKAVGERLSAIDPDDADLYETNVRLAVASLEALDSDIDTQLAPLGDKPFVTFHDAYSYFVERYGLDQVGQLMVEPEQRPGAATLSALRTTIASEGVSCAFAEPQFDAGAVRAMAGDEDMRVGTLDPLGVGIEPGPMLYGTLLRKNADAVGSCLAPTS